MIVLTLQDMVQLPLYGFDIVELRLDRIPYAMDKTRDYLCNIHTKVLLTYRSTSIDEVYISKIKEIASLKPDYIDIQLGSPLGLFAYVRMVSKKTKIIISYHNFDQTPSDLESIFAHMKAYDADYQKIVAFASSSIDGLKMLQFLKQQQSKTLTAFCMGEYGQFTRILSKKFGSIFHFTAISGDNGLSQFPLDVLINRYRFNSIDQHTTLYGLLGYPVLKSMSESFHNEEFKKLKANAVYVKIALKEEDIKEAWALIQTIGFSGLSITMPLKNKFDGEVCCGDDAGYNTHIINTICFGDKIVAFNTDAIAIESLLCKGEINKKRVLILGAGSVAEVAAFVLSKYQCELLFFNRTREKANSLAKKYQGLALDEINKEISYDILINTTSIGMDEVGIPISPEFILPNTVVFDVVSNPVWTPLMQEASAKSCKLIFGKDMFYAQAEHQLACWGLARH